MRFVVSFLAAMIGSRVIFNYFGFQYSVFEDPFDLMKFAIDMGVFLFLFVSSSWLFDFVSERLKK